MPIRCGLLVLCAVAVSADVYLHTPRGSNNRLDDENRDRNNANRVFDSQNNNRGGSNVGRLYYHEESKVSIEWTAQHGCASGVNKCDFVLQYMCDPRVRDGTTQQTIPENPKECYNWDCDTDVRFGRHESVDSYLRCKYRSRNNGLFIASQKLKGGTAKYTRQNPNGARRGLECPEERDYFPYWGESPWKTIAVVTDDKPGCETKLKELNHNKDGTQKGHCQMESMRAYERWLAKNRGSTEASQIPIELGACQMFSYEDPLHNQTGKKFGAWHDDPIQATPKCAQAQWSRANHLGNVQDKLGGATQTASYLWTIPKEATQMGKNQNCVLRIRYNITTVDLQSTTTNSEVLQTTKWADLNASHNENKNGVNIGLQMFNITDTNDEYNLFKNNPKVNIFREGNAATLQNVKVQLAVNTAQYGRTFQDRSHVFEIRQQSAETANLGCTIHNLGVRGKRGNIVQTYPGTEYDFSPSPLNVGSGECVHIQWTGSNTNPNNNAGQGRQGTDRSNIACLAGGMKEGQSMTQCSKGAEYGDYSRSYPGFVDSSNGADKKCDFLGLDEEAILDAMTLRKQNLGADDELDDAGTYFDLGVKKVQTKGCYNFLSTRNNNFSNRSQKGKIVVNLIELTRVVAAEAEQVVMAGGRVEFAANSLQAPQSVTLVNDPEERMIGVLPVTLLLDNKMSVCVVYTGSLSGLQKPKLMESKNPDGPWTDVKDTTQSDGTICGNVAHGGYFKAEGRANVGAIVGIVLGSLAAIALAAFLIMKWKKQGSPSSLYQNRV